jgi:hypothetical protein
LAEDMFFKDGFLGVTDIVQVGEQTECDKMCECVTIEGNANGKDLRREELRHKMVG